MTGLDRECRSVGGSLGFRILKDHKGLEFRADRDLGLGV